jgi:DNA-binding protein
MSGDEGEENIVYVGRKPVMSYVLAVITHFSRTNAKEVTLKARGRAITTAVDVAEITRRRFMDKLVVDKITIGTEEIFEQQTNQNRAVSTIEITLSMSE